MKLIRTVQRFAGCDSEFAWISLSIYLSLSLSCLTIQASVYCQQKSRFCLSRYFADEVARLFPPSTTSLDGLLCLKHKSKILWEEKKFKEALLMSRSLLQFLLGVFLSFVFY